MIREIKFGLRNEGCNDYLCDGEYTHYWYVSLERAFWNIPVKYSLAYMKI